MSTLFTALTRYAQEKPDAVALHDNDITLTYGALPEAIHEKETLLLKAGVNVLGLPLANSVEWILWDLAALKADVICVPLPSFFTAQQITHVLASAGIDTCVSGKQLTAMPPQKNVSIPAETAKITFTSGTTGTPKGVCLSAARMEQVSQSLLSAIGSEYGERHLSVMPLAILLENIAGVYTALLAGAQVFIPSPASIGMDQPFRPDFAKLLEFVAKHRITSIILTPELLRGLLGTIRANVNQPCASLRFIAVGGATVPPALLQAARSKGLPVYEGYGLSECASVVALNTPGSDHPGTVGKILPHVQLKICDGEVIIHNPAFLGYLGNAPRNPADEFATGDNGSLDNDGVLSISGRRKNTIITTQGRNIAPEWVESLLLSQPGVAQAFVYGEGLPFPQALIVPTEPDLLLHNAVSRVNEMLPNYAQIADFHLVSPFTPQNGMLTATGRLRRNHIADVHQQLMKGIEDHDILRHAN